MVYVRQSIFFTIILAIFCAGTLFAGPKSQETKVYYAPGEVLVKFKQEVATDAFIMSGLLQARGAKVLRQYSMVRGLQHIKVANSDVKEMVAALQNHPLVEYAEPNYIVTINEEPEAKIPNDERFGELWGLHNIGQNDSENREGVMDADIDAPEAWVTTTGSSDVIVGVIDTGVNYNHKDLAGNMWTNTHEIPGNNEDDDGNGYVDDVHGYNFVSQNGDPMDDHGHGSHCAGTIAAMGNNEIGVIGVAPHTNIMALKFLGADGSGRISDAVTAVEYATQMNAQILSNSWGGGGYSRAMFDAIGVANGKNMVFVAAAGNRSRNNDQFDHYPSNYERPNVIAVAASTNQDALADFSHYGLNSVHIAAPGENILSTVLDDGYDVYSGTSMATPHVSGVASLLLSLFPEMTPAQVRERIMRSSDEIISIRRKISSAGRLNAYNAVHDIQPSKRGPKIKNWTELSYSISTPHNYESNTDAIWTLQYQGATYMKVHFSRFNTESGYDYVVVTDKNGKEADRIEGYMESFWSYVVEGDTINISFKSDGSVQLYGFDINKYAYSTDTPE